MKSSKAELNAEINRLAIKLRKECPADVKRFTDYVVDKIYNHKAPRYYIEYLTARKIVFSMLDGKNIKHKNVESERKYKSLCDKILEYKKDFPDKNPYKYLEKILLEPADSFYLSKSTILGILYGK